MIKMKLKKNENENSPNLKYVIYILPFSYIFLSYWSFQDKNLRHLFAHDSIFKSILGVGSVSEVPSFIFMKSMVHVQKSVYEPYNIIFFHSLTTQNECQCVIVTAMACQITFYILANQITICWKIAYRRAFENSFREYTSIHHLKMTLNQD